MLKKKRVKKLPALLCLQIACAVPLIAQHHVTKSQVIEGSKNPELIPDKIAYLHVFLNLAATAGASATDHRIQLSHLQAVGLNTADLQAATVVLTEFRSQHDSWVARWNEQAQEAGFSPVALVKQEEDMVQGTRDLLKRVLSPIGMLSFDTFAQSFKKSITLHTGGLQ